MKVRFASPYFLLVVALWLGVAAGLAAITHRVADWFVMTDELLYERLALSIARTHSPIPHVHATTVSNINQLYPLIISPVFRHGAVLHGFHEAHVLNAVVMSSAAIPVYLLASRVTARGWVSVVAAVLAVTLPWMTLSSFLLTEVAAYPAFAWAALAMQAAVARPSVRNDLLAVAAIAIAVLARTQFYALAAVLPLAIAGQAAVEHRLRRVAREHPALAAVYAVGAVTALGLALAGHGLLGTYGSTVKGNPLPASIITSAPAHLAIVGLGSGLLPLLLGGAWFISNLRRSETSERHAFAWLSVVAVLVLTVEVASFDLRFGGGLVRERYLFYLAPLLLVGFCAAVTAVRPPRWSLCVPLLVLAFGFSKAPLSAFEKLNVDTPASVLNNWLLGSLGGINGVRIFLVLASVVLAVAYVEGALLLPRTALTIALSVLLLAALPAETGYAFKRLFAVNGTSGLPLTLDQSVVFGWVDREITTNSEAVMVPYPVIRADFWSNIGFWWDLEFWNRSVDREAGRPSQFSGTPPGSFPKIDLRFDPRTGKANFDVDSYVAQAADDVRFHVKGRLLTTQRGVSIVFPDRPWRADWVSYGLWPDGWTRPHRTARIRVFPDLRQKTARERTLTLTLVTPESVPRRAVSLRSNSGSWTAEVTAAATEQVVTLCVPPGRPADVTLSTAGATPIYGDQSTIETSTQAREAGVLVGQIVLTDAPGVRCAPSRRRP